MCLYLKDLWKYWKYEIHSSENGEMANNKGNLKIKGTANILGIWCNFKKLCTISHNIRVFIKV